MTLIDLKKVATVTWAVPILSALLLASAIGCSGEPQVVEKIVEVEKVVEVEVPVEVVKEVEVPASSEMEALRKELESLKEAMQASEAAGAGSTGPGASAPTPSSPSASTPAPTETPNPTATTFPTPTPTQQVLILLPTPTPRPLPTATARPRPTAIPTPIPTATPLPALDISESISAGSSHTCALRESGEPVCWGHKEAVQAAPSDGRFTSISAGSWYTCGLQETGQVVCWGSDKYGQASPPGYIFTSISAGWEHTCGLRESGEAWCWGNDKYGRGYGRVSAPAGRFTSISAGGSHTCGLRESGQAVCWPGGGGAPDGRFVEISAGGSHTCGLRENGEAECWGSNSSGRSSVPDGRRFMSISAGGSHTCGLRENGEALCWGNNEQGRASAPAGSFVVIRAGGSHTCGLRENGEAVCWGNNDEGQSASRTGPFAVPSSSGRSRPDNSPSVAAYNSLDSAALPASILARFSTSNAIEGEERSAAVNEIVSQYRSGDVDDTRVLDLLHTIAPELSIEERRKSAHLLALSAEDGNWDEEQTAQGVFYLATLITGDEPNGEERIYAAQQLVGLYESGNLTADTALHWMDTIAPSLGINERRQAAAALAQLAADGDLDETERMAAASEVFRLVTGVPLAAEQRIGATVDLAGVGVKIFGDGQFDAQEIVTATTVIKRAISGSLTTESLQDLLGFGN